MNSIVKMQSFQKRDKDYRCDSQREGPKTSAHRPNPINGLVALRRTREYKWQEEVRSSYLLWVARLLLQFIKIGMWSRLKDTRSESSIKLPNWRKDTTDTYSKKRQQWLDLTGQMPIFKNDNRPWACCYLYFQFCVIMIF